MGTRPRNGAPSIVFRVDASRHIGMGHATRCATLASELRRRGAFVRFVCRDFPWHFAARLRAFGVDVDRLPLAPDADLGGDESAAAGSAASVCVSEEQDARETIGALAERSVDWVVLDHYGLGLLWEHEIRAVARNILVIDDLANRPHGCDTLLDQNWAGEDTEGRYAGLVADGTLRLLGPRYALLQPDYAALRSSRQSRKNSMRRVVVSFGGSDPSNETAKVLDALASPEFAYVTVDVVVSSQHPEREGIARKAAARARTTLHGDLPSLAPLLAQADLAIGAGGATTWERICLGVPSIVTTIAENQVPFTAALAQTGVVRWVGRSALTTADSYRRALAEGIDTISQIPPLVDGLGTLRVAETIVPTDIRRFTLRRARPEDAIFFFGWRTESSVRAMSFSTGPISWDAHLAWFEGKLEQAESELFIAEAESLPIGQLRLDFAEQEGVLSYAVDTVARGRGVGKWIISEALRRTSRQPPRGYRAVVKPENEASKRVFRSLGWTDDPSSTEHSCVFRFPLQRSIGPTRVVE